MSERLNNRERILDTVSKLAKQHLLAPLPLLAFGDVAGGLEDQAAARQRPQLDAALTVSSRPSLVRWVSSPLHVPLSRSFCFKCAKDDPGMEGLSSSSWLRPRASARVSP